MISPITTRRAGVDDVEALLANVTAGFASYAAFAPVGWRPPDPYPDRGLEIEMLADPGTWALLALVETAAVGHVTFMPARRREPGEPRAAWRDRSVVPGLAHLRQLFVLPDWWGRGVAPLLHDAAIGEMTARGYAAARLFTPSAHVRARRFYERRGWAPADEAWNDDLSLSLIEYRLALAGQRPSSSQPARYGTDSSARMSA